MKNKNSAVDYPPFEFNGKRIPIEILFGNEMKNQKTKKLNNKSQLNFSKKCQKVRSKSTLPSSRLLKTDTYVISLTERMIQTKRITILLPFKNAVEKIRSQNREVFTRRKSCYGQFFGDIQQKQMMNFPTSVEMHKKINGKEFALSSFADLLKKNQRKSTTKRNSIVRKLSKQVSLVEYDNMERPPSCKTPRDSKIFVTKKKVSATLKEKYMEGQKLKLSHFMNESKSRKMQLSSIPFANSIKTRRENIQYKACMTEYISAQRSPLSSFRLTQNARPYKKQNELLSKLIKSEYKSRSHYIPKSTINVFCY